MRILIADDHEVVRSGLRRILASQPNWEVVAEAADGKEAITKAAESKPDVAVLDYSLPRINGMRKGGFRTLNIPSLSATSAKAPRC